mmetsp:Transcript_46512/g.90858  ORF Transcript_46512/g.90858 Transcript_46512/m.90858 type:complete len:213 (+) Transcript_46512:313-951(+)
MPKMKNSANAIATREVRRIACTSIPSSTKSSPSATRARTTKDRTIPENVEPDAKSLRPSPVFIQINREKTGGGTPAFSARLRASRPRCQTFHRRRPATAPRPRRPSNPAPPRPRTPVVPSSSRTPMPSPSHSTRSTGLRARLPVTPPATAARSVAAAATTCPALPGATLHGSRQISLSAGRSARPPTRANANTRGITTGLARWDSTRPGNGE